MKDPGKYIGVLLTLLGGICWGFSGACGQFLLQNKGIDAGWLVSFRMLSAGVLLLVFSALRGDIGKALWKKPRDILHLIVFSVLGLAASQFTYFVAIGLSNAGTATVLEYLAPIFIMVYTAVRGRQRPGIQKLIVLALALLGTLILSTHGNLHQLAISGEALLWGLAAAAAHALYNILPGSLMEKYGTLPVVGFAMLLGGGAMAVPSQIWKPAGTFDASAVLALLGVVVVGTLFSFTAYLEGVRRICPEKASLYACIEPLSAALFAVLWLHTTLLSMDFLGFACVLLAVTLLSLSTGKHHRFPRLHQTNLLRRIDHEHH